MTPDGPAAAGAREQGRPWLPLHLERRFRPLTDVSGSVRLWRDMRRHRFDIVHTHAIKVGLVGRVVAAAARVPIVVHTLHGLAYARDTPAPRRLVHALLERVANRRVDAILAQSREDAATLVATGAAPASRITWVGNGIDLARFDPGAHEGQRDRVRAALGVARTDVLFLTAGRLVREKGTVELLEAAARARAVDARVRLAVAGEVDREKADAVDDGLLARAAAAGVLVLGRREDMPAVHAAADVVVLPSWREGLPRVLMEGAAMGRALLATDVRGCREVVTHGENGLLVPVRDPEALAGAMTALAADPRLRQRFGDRNRALALERFDVRAAVARVVAVYDRLLAERGAVR